MKKITLLIFIFLSEFMISQSLADTLNKYNAKNNKQGYWIAYFGERLCQVSTKEEAYYFTYFYFDDGYSFDGLFCPRACKSRNSGTKFETPGEKPIKGSPVLLNGNFKTYDEKGNVFMNENFINGAPGLIEDYNYDKHGKCTSKNAYDFSKKYNDQICSWHFENYGPDLKLKDSYYLAKNNKGKWVEIK